MGVRVYGNGGRGVYALVEEFGGRAGGCMSGDGRGGGCGGGKGRGGEWVGRARREERRVWRRVGRSILGGVDRDGMVYRFCLMGKFWR